MWRIKSLLIWGAIGLLVLFWLPALGIIYLTGRDELRYRTGYCFRKLGMAITRVNPFWKVTVEGGKTIHDRQPYVMVSNHLSNADIPVISNLPWEMKWIAKRQLFELPILGWMMKMAGDIPVDRSTGSHKVATFKRCIFYLRNHISVMFFPEGTRSRDGRVNRFSKGAFELAIREQVSILPMAIDGTHGCLPKNSWVFEPDVHARLKVLEPVSTKGFNSGDVDELVKIVRNRIIEHLMEQRGAARQEVDAMFKKAKAEPAGHSPEME